MSFLGVGYPWYQVPSRGQGIQEGRVYPPTELTAALPQSVRILLECFLVAIAIAIPIHSIEKICIHIPSRGGR